MTVRSVYKVYGVTARARLYEDDTSERWLHIYFNPSRQAAERELLVQRIEKLRQFLDKHRGQGVQFGSTYQDYFVLHYHKNGRFLYAEERSDVVQRELELCGNYCIVTSEELSASQALMHYKGRDMSEKLFHTDKTFIGSKSMRSHSEETLSAQKFVEFIALIVRNRIYNLLNETLFWLQIDFRPNYMSVPAALRELEKIEMVRRSNEQYRLGHAVSNVYCKLKYK